MYILLMTLACFGSKDTKTEAKAPEKKEQTAKVEKKAEPVKPKFKPDAPAADAGSTPEEKAALTKAEGSIEAIREAVKTQLAEAMKGDLGAAVPVCGSAAQGAIDAAKKDGVTAGRSSSKLRNPKNAPPDWVETWLKEQPVDALASNTKGFSRVDTTDKGKVARVLKPLTTEATCLRCHGLVEKQDPAVKAVLSAKYPNDAATGYTLGTLRGAAYAEVPL